jgi:hypothetical protein
MQRSEGTFDQLIGIDRENTTADAAEGFRS